MGLVDVVSALGFLALTAGLIIAALVVAMLLVIVIHELGHAIAAVLLGFRVHEISIGVGKVVGAVDLGATRLRLRKRPGGYVVVSTRHRWMYRGRNVVVLLAGSALPIVAAGWLARLELGPLANSIATGVLVVTLVIAAMSLWSAPRTFGANDGWQIVDTLRADRRSIDLRIERAPLIPSVLEIGDLAESGDRASSRSAAERLAREHPDWPLALALQANAELDADECESALGHAEQCLRLAYGEADAAMIALAKALVAYSLAIVGAPERMERAEDLANEAKGFVPIDGILGAVLVRIGDCDEAEVLLTRAATVSHLPADRYTHFAFLALSALRRQDIDASLIHASNMRSEGVEPDRLEREVRLHLGAALAVKLLREGPESVDPCDAAAQWAVSGWLAPGARDRQLWSAFAKQGGDLDLVSPEALGRILEWSTTEAVRT